MSPKATPAASDDQTGLDVPIRYPHAKDSMEAARQMIGAPTRGKMKVIRRYTSVGIALWRIEASLNPQSGPDYELELEGDDLDEVSFALVDALERLGLGQQQ